jgi:hypothetical protein
VSLAYAAIGASASDGWSFLLACVLSMALPAIVLVVIPALARIRP